MSLRRSVILQRPIDRAFKSLKGKSNSSARWVRRQWNDPIVQQAKREGLRSRAAIKLREIHQRYQIFQPKDLVLDLGAAPGGWTQIAVEATRRSSKQEKNSSWNVISLDLVPFDPIDGAIQITGDFRQPDILDEIDKTLNNRSVQVVLSDMAPSFSGHFLKDSQAQLRLCENALTLAKLYLVKNGHFVTKILRCEDTEAFRLKLKKQFQVVKAMKPQSSRSESTEMFLIAKGYQPNDENET